MVDKPAAPEALPHTATRGVAAGPAGELALVYWAREMHRHLAVAVLGDGGWTLEARVLPEASHGRLAAVRYDGATLEVVYQPDYWDSSKGSHKPPIVARVGPSGKLTTRRFPIPSCGDAPGQRRRLCRLIRKEKTWEAWFSTVPKMAAAIELEGRQRPVPEGRCDSSAGMLVEATVLGLTKYGHYAALGE